MSVSIVNKFSSIIDSDLYKFSMQNAVIKRYPRSKVKYEFINRGNTEFPEGFDLKLREEIRWMETLNLKEEEADFLTEKCGDFLDPTYIDFLKGYRYNSSEVGIIQEGGDLKITIQGYWYRTILWEVPLMAVISELYFKMTGKNLEKEDRKILEKRNIEKGKLAHFNNLKIADFGTRRRESFENHNLVISDLKNCFNSKDFLVGTSNVYFAFKHNLTPIGTHAHEFVSGIAALKGYYHANKHMMDDWISVYQGNLGIALTDTFGLEAFLKDFNVKYAKLFDGVRHDSGDPFDFADRIIRHYESLGIDPLSKTIVFSDGLNMDVAVEIHKHCKGRIKCSFGIGTNLTNDVGIKPLNMVIKLTSIDGKDVIKLSDIPGKHTGNKETIDLVKKMISYNSVSSKISLSENVVN